MSADFRSYRRTRNTLLLLLFVCLPTAVKAVTVAGAHFVDEDGAIIIFRGYNIQTKAPPFQPIQSASELDPLQQIGTNLIRFNFIWEAAEPQPGIYDETYFEYYDRVVNWAWERGMYVLIDFHNNAFSRYAADGCGAGFPVWALSPDVQPVTPKPNGSCNFTSAMLSAMLSTENYANWRDFMSDAHGVRTRFFALTQKLAEKYHDHPAVIGFDLNEPMVFTPILQYDSVLANRFFNAWQQFIAGLNPRYITFWGDSPFQYIFVNQPPRLDLPTQSNIALDAHFYEPGASGLGQPLFGINVNINAIVATREQYGIPVLVGEFGAKLNGTHNDLFQFQMDMVQREFDRHLLSSARWNYTPHWTKQHKDNFHDEDFSCFDDQKQLRESCAPRANLQRLSGDLISLDIHHRNEAKFFVPLLPRLSRLFQYHEAVVDLQWNHDPARGSTRIFASRQLIFDGKPVQLETSNSDLDCHYDTAERYVECSSDTAGPKHLKISAP